MKEHIAVIIEGRILNAKESKDKDWIKKVSLKIAEDILNRDNSPFFVEIPNPTH